MRWTKEMNLNVIRAYFRATKCSSISLGYRKVFHSEWLKMYPESVATEQRICDQKRTIFTRKLLSQYEIDNVKQEVQSEFDMNLLHTSQDSQNNETGQPRT